jgi:hypothetical protein
MVALAGSGHARVLLHLLFYVRQGYLNMTVAGVSGLYCAPPCSNLYANRCDPSTPAGVTASPECVVAAEVNQRWSEYCALVCNSDAQCDVRGGATCQAINGVGGVSGVCAYPYTFFYG